MILFKHTHFFQYWAIEQNLARSWKPRMIFGLFSCSSMCLYENGFGVAAAFAVVARMHAHFPHVWCFLPYLPRQVLASRGPAQAASGTMGTYCDLHALRVFWRSRSRSLILCIVVAVSCVGWRRVLQRNVVAECCRDVLRRSVAEEFCRGERSREGL